VLVPKPRPKIVESVRAFKSKSRAGDAGKSRKALSRS